MSEAPIRAMCMRQTEDSFYLAVKKPLWPHSARYNRLMELARCAVYNLQEGSQVFVYSREEFNVGKNDGNFTDADKFNECVVFTASQFNEPVAIDPKVENVSDRVAPFSEESIRV